MGGPYQQLHQLKNVRARATPTQEIESSPLRGSLFRQHRETVEQMLVRKLRQKYIDGNPAFSNGLDDANSSISTIKSKVASYKLRP